MFQIENEQLVAQVKAQGAELCSLKSQKYEYIWQADPQHWARHTPVLFPIVGKLKENSFVHEGKKYELSQHGFARDMVFEKYTHTKNQIWFVLKTTPETSQKYPFDFCLKIGYELIENQLITHYLVENTSTQKMYFSIGGHPAYRCPFYEKTQRNEYHLEFERKENAEKHLLEGSFFSGKTEKCLENTAILPLSDTIFDNDALVFKNLASKKVSLYHQNKQVWSFHFPNFPYLGIWSKSQDSPFVCIEPWFGLADSVDANGEISQKEGIIALNPRQIFKCSYTLEIFE